MNRLVRVALVLAATLAVTMPAQALEDVRGWRNTTWKMSESEVKRSVGALGLVVTPVPASPAPPADGPVHDEGRHRWQRVRRRVLLSR